MGLEPAGPEFGFGAGSTSDERAAMFDAAGTQGTPAMSKGTHMCRMGCIAAACALVLGWSVSGLSARVGLTGAADTKDVIILVTGKTIEGQILEETQTRIKVMVRVGTIEAPRWYERSDILSIERDVPDEAADEPEPAPVMAAKDSPEADSTGDDHAATVYVIKADGVFGQDITQTPLRQAVADAREHDVDYLIVELDNDWSRAQFGGWEEDKLKEDDAIFDQLWRAEDMDMIFTEEIQREWKKKPTIVFWVKNAMGGAAFLPLNIPNIYFSSDAKMGGIGNLAEIFKGVGDEVVREKQRSLRLGHAKGMANVGGYDSRIVKAMTRTDYVLSLGYEGGKPVLVEGWPDPTKGQRLLCDDAKDANKDSIEELARGEGNDVLTLDADLAYDLGVSKGTADTLDDLLFELGISRNYKIVKGRSDKIMDGWSQGLAMAKKELRKLLRDYNEVAPQPPGGYQQRTAARGSRKRLFKQMKRLLTRYKEGITRQWMGQYGIPSIQQIDIQLEQIRLEQMKDKK